MRGGWGRCRACTSLLDHTLLLDGPRDMEGFVLQPVRPALLFESTFHSQLGIRKILDDGEILFSDVDHSILRIARTGVFGWLFPSQGRTDTFSPDPGYMAKHCGTLSPCLPFSCSCGPSLAPQPSPPLLGGHPPAPFLRSQGSEPLRSSHYSPTHSPRDVNSRASALCTPTPKLQDCQSNCTRGHVHSHYKARATLVFISFSTALQKLSSKVLPKRKTIIPEMVFGIFAH